MKLVQVDFFFLTQVPELVGESMCGRTESSWRGIAGLLSLGQFRN